MNKIDAGRDEFYVGYLPEPPGYLRFVKIAAPLILLGSLAVGMIVTRSHNNPGDGVWNDSTEHYEGVIASEPYAILWMKSKSSDSLQSLLLVSEGKFGARERAEKFQGQMVRVRGTLLERDGRRMLELLDEENAIELLDASTSVALPRPMEIGSTKLRGEIIDPKCYLGAMKPGEGKPHKECATLCISGGIPPMFVTHDQTGHGTYYLLTDSRGMAVNNGVLPYVADPVEVEGKLARLGDLILFRIDPTQIHRL